ncbi:hypothetical protein [Nocardia sp. NPDC059195]|uniref:hypothetical protein n=1 Tax=Nocardia sp. NPDC059195 TaxID=3346765 RepID=UPI0036973554
MHVAIVAWKLRQLKDREVTFAELREWVRTKAAADYAALPGVRLKTWFSDERRAIWGAVYLVDSPSDLRLDKLPRLPDGRTGPVGTPPHVVDWFDVEASVFGPADPWELPLLGRVHDPNGT